MNKVYKSIVSKLFLVICIGFVAAFIVSLFFCYHILWILLINILFGGMGIALLIDILIHTDYTIKGEKLHIRSGILFNITLPICKISQITEESTILSSPALSLKRIKITYGRNNIVYISPQNQENFIKDLLLINPNIIVKV